MKYKFTIIILLMSGLLVVSSCRSGGLTKKQRYAEKSEVQLQKENEKMTAEYRQHHYDIQAEETQKMIKKSKKRAKKINRKKQGNFFDRLFRSNRSRDCGGN
jgi:hypothetical protein